MRVRGVLHPAFLALTSASALAHALWYTLFPVYLRASALELWQVGAISSLVLTLSFVLALPAGVTADAAPTRWALALASAGQLVPALLVLLAPHPLLLLASVVTYTFFLALRGQAALRLLAVSSSQRSWSTIYSAYLLLAGASGVAGSYLSGPLAERRGFGAVYLASAALFSLALALSLFVEIVPGGGGRRVARNLKVLRNRDFARLTASLALHDLAVFSAMTYVQIFQREVVGLSLSQISLLAAVGSAASQAAQLGAGHFADSFGAKKALALHYLGVSAGYAAMGVGRSFEDLLAATLVQSAFLPFDMPARRKLLSLMAPESAVATVNGLSDAIVGLVSLPAPLLGGYLWYGVGPRGMLAACAALNLTAFLPLASLREGSERGARFQDRSR